MLVPTGVDRLKGEVCLRVYEPLPRRTSRSFLGDADLSIDSLWRIFVDGKVALTSRDHAQQSDLLQNSGWLVGSITWPPARAKECGSAWVNQGWLRATSYEGKLTKMR
jgi:hypothetical protein